MMEQNAAQLTVGEKLLVWFEANKRQAVWGTGIVLVVGMIVFYYVWSQSVKEVRAAEALSQVTADSLFSGPGRIVSTAEYLKVADAHPGTPAAGRALLLAGGELFSEGKYAESLTQFQRFTREYPGNPFMSQALLGIGVCLDAQGKVDEAAQAYKEAVDRYPSASTTAQAKFGLARSYELQGKLDQARSLYEELSRAESFSFAGNEAALRLEALKAGQPATAPEASASTNLPAFRLSTP